MKKLFFTFAAVTFCATLSFSQTNHQYTSDKLEIERLSNTVETSGKKKIEINELPLQIQEALQTSEYKEWQVAEIYEIEEAGTGWVDEDIPLEEGQSAASLISDFSYEIVLLNQDVKEEVDHSQEAIADEQEDALDEEVAAGTETAKVEAPAIILLYDQDGKLLNKEESTTEGTER